MERVLILRFTDLEKERRAKKRFLMMSLLLGCLGNTAMPTSFKLQHRAEGETDSGIFTDAWTRDERRRKGPDKLSKHFGLQCSQSTATYG